MARLPSYEEAVSGGHWLDLVAPYIAIREYSRLSRVSRRFYNQFAPRLWNDPLQTARLLGLHPNDDLDWFIYFVTRHAKVVRSSTRKLITSIDFRGFGADAPALVAGSNGRSFSETLRLMGVLFPAVRCILLGGKADYDPADFVRLLKPEDFPEDGSVPTPLILDMGHCSLPLPNAFFHSSYWRQLVYLDMSDLPGSLKGIVKTGTFHQGALPNLRILKLRGRELDEASLASITESSVNRIWSMDLSRNKLADSSVHALFYQCFSAADLTTERGRSEVEGKLAVLADDDEADIPPLWRGWFSYIVESSSSAMFSHPDRYLADSPVYDRGSQPRLVGNEPLRSDSAEDVKIALAGGSGLVVPDWHGIGDVDICRPPSSLTHLYLSGNTSFTMEGVESLFRCSRGHIEHFDFASPAILTDSGVPFELAGILGRSHIFRPVFASNLRSLRIHHSLVTHIPTVAHPSKSALAALEYAETVLRERAELAYPQAFVPDMNPRVRSLTLTCLPRVSTGPLIDKLIKFLVSAYEQEEGIRRATVSMSRRGPTMLRGLRHIRLEFEPYPPNDDLDDGFDSLDAEALLHSGTNDFSFFGEAAWLSSTAGAETSAALNKESGGHGTGNALRQLGLPSPAGTSSPPPLNSRKSTGNAALTSQSDRLPHYPLPGAPDADGEYVREIITWGDEGNKHPVSVWVGSGVLGPHRAVNAYMVNLSKPSLRAQIRPATPDQTKGGVPAGACVYNAAWDAILWSDEATGPTSVATSDSHRQGTRSSQGDNHHQMRDVVDAIRKFRKETKSGQSAVSAHPSQYSRQRPSDGTPERRPTHCHWTGTLEVLLAS